MLSNFQSRLGESITNFSETIRAERNRQKGIPTFSFWATASDPRTKKRLSPLLTEEDPQQLWKDVASAVMDIAEQSNNDNNGDPDRQT
jgi:hypothetical protein